MKQRDTQNVYRASRPPCPVGPPRPGGFTLVELLVVIGIIAVLISVLLPTLTRARQAGAKAVCASNLRQLVTACHLYAAEHRGYLPPAHLDFVTRNLSRWHGTRPRVDAPFDFEGSPMRRVLGGGSTPAVASAVGVSAGERVKRCPSFDPAVADAVTGAFEAASGGYGYNAAYLGSSTHVPALAALSLPAAEFDARVSNVPARLTQVRRHAETVAFTDAAMAVPGLIEYSFAEPPMTSSGTLTNSPSVHFRHRKRANVAWLDGHVTDEAMSYTPPRNAYRALNPRFDLGFFGPRDNTLFDRD